jgi:hypothetical protein
MHHHPTLERVQGWNTPSHLGPEDKPLAELLALLLTHTTFPCVYPLNQWLLWGQKLQHG